MVTADAFPVARRLGSKPETRPWMTSRHLSSSSLKSRAVLCAFMSLTACGPTSPSTPADHLPDHQSTLPTAVSLRAMMTAGGCTPTVPPPSGQVIVMTAPDGTSEAYDCRAIGTDSMLSLADAYRAMVHPGNKAPGAQAPEGYWSSEGYWREYCWVNPLTGVVVQCGIWRYEERPVWVRGADGMAPTDYPSGGGGGSGGGTGSSPAAPQPDPWCPSEDPDCWRLPDDDEKKLFRNVQQYLRPSSQISDPVAREQCAMVASWLQDALATMDNGNNSKIWVGTSDDDKYPHRFHLGETDGAGDRFHIDPAIVDSATKGRNQVPWKRELLALLMHEAAHLRPNNQSHPNATAILRSEPRPIPPASVLYRDDPPFNYVHSENAATACVEF